MLVMYGFQIIQRNNIKHISGQIIIIRRSLGRISYFQMEISLGR